jgi:hypothetical protein
MIRKKQVCICLLFLVFIFCVYNISSIANPIPVYPDPKPTFEPTTAITQVQNESFVLWLILIWFLDIALNTLFLYGGFLLLVRLHMESTGWFSQVPRKTIVIGIFLLSIAGIISEWLIGSWLGGIFFIAIVVFVITYLLSQYLFKLKSSSSLFIAFYMIVLNLISWAIIYSL